MTKRIRAEYRKMLAFHEPRQGVFAHALSYMAGYGLKAYLITQDIRQIVDAYGPNESIVSNCHLRVAFTPNQYETADLLSKMTGTQTIQKATYNFSGKRNAPVMNHINASVENVERPLMTPDEVSRLSNGCSNEKRKWDGGRSMSDFRAAVREGFSLDALLERMAEKVAERLQNGDQGGAANGDVRPRLLTVEQAAVYIGRTKDAVHHMIASGKLPTVRSDRRVFIDMRDLDTWIEENKQRGLV